MGIHCEGHSVYSYCVPSVKICKTHFIIGPPDQRKGDLALFTDFTFIWLEFSQSLNSLVHLGWMVSHGSKEGLRQKSRGPFLWPCVNTGLCMELPTTSAWNHVSERDMDWGTPQVRATWYRFFYDFLFFLPEYVVKIFGVDISSFSFHWCIVLHCLTVLQLNCQSIVRHLLISWQGDLC